MVGSVERRYGATPLEV